MATDMLLWLLAAPFLGRVPAAGDPGKTSDVSPSRYPPLTSPSASGPYSVPGSCP